MFIKGVTGREFLVEILNVGDRYGLGDSLTWDKDGQGIEFYDFSLAGPKFGGKGQFIARYYLDTILESKGGLDLLGYVPEWKVSGAEMDRLRRVFGKFFRFVGSNGEVEVIEADSYESACVELVGILGWGINGK